MVLPGRDSALCLLVTGPRLRFGVEGFLCGGVKVYVVGMPYKITAQYVRRCILTA